MADEEKNTSEEIDDWLDDFEEADKSGAKIDQSDIDAVLSGDGTEDPLASLVPAESETGSSEIDQAEIDALFAGQDDQPAAAAPAPPPEPAEALEADSLDQSDIDALLGGDTSPPSPPAEAAADNGEIDQSDIDALLGNGGNEAVTAEAAPADDSDAGPVSQEDIDALFADNGDSDAPEPEMTATADEEPEPVVAAVDTPVDQSEIDALFGDLGTETVTEASASEGSDQTDIDDLFNEFTSDTKEEGKPFTAEEVDFNELLAEGKGGDEAFTLGEDDLGTMGGGDFTINTDEAVPGADFAGEEIFAEDEPTQALPDFLADSTTAGEEPTQEFEQEKKFAVPFHLPDALRNRKTMGGAALLLLLLVGGYLFFTRPGKEPAIVLPPAGEEQAAVPETTVNLPPQAIAASYKMPTGGGEIPIQLTAEDNEKDPLTYEITIPPAHGRLSGELPKVVYLPNRNFPGEDRFSYRVSDGNGISMPAEIIITGPNLSGQPATMVAKAQPPRKPPLRAADVTIPMRSTEALDLDWRHIWKEANRSSLPANVSVEIVGKNLHGRLTATGPARHHYQPDPYFSGQETIRYRFKRGKATSKTRQLHLELALGEPPPQIRLAPLADSYQVGERVVVDASTTRDESRDTLRFAWEQTAGTPVLIQPLNKEGSKVSFMVPSSFHTVAPSGPTLRLTATDDSGQEVSREITVTTVSRRKTALWRGLPGGSRVAREPDCPQGRCPGGLLPWRYPD